MACIQLETQQFYQPPMAVSFSRNRLPSSRSLNAAPEAAIRSETGRFPNPSLNSISETATEPEVPQDAQRGRDKPAFNIESELPSIESILSAVEDPGGFWCADERSESTFREADIHNRSDSVAAPDGLRPGRSRDDPVLLDGDVSEDGERDESRGGDYSDRGTPGRSSSRIVSECRGADERIPLALCDPQITSHDFTAQPIATRVNDTSSTPPFRVIGLETEKSSSLLADAEMAKSLRDGVGAQTNKDKVDSSRPKSRREVGSDNRPRSQDEDDAVDDNSIGDDARSGHHDDGAESSEDPNDDDYTDDADAADPHPEEQPRPSKRRRQKEKLGDRAHTTSFSGSVDGASPGIGNGSSITAEESEEIPIRGFLTLKRIESKVVYSLIFSRELPPCTAETARRQRVTRNDSRDVTGMNAVQSSQPENAMERTGRRPPLSSKDDTCLVELKEKGLSWAEIAERFPGWPKGALQVHYCIKLDKRPREERRRGRKRQRPG